MVDLVKNIKNRIKLISFDADAKIPNRDMYLTLLLFGKNVNAAITKFECIVHQKLVQAAAEPGVRILTGSRIEKISKSQNFEIQLTQKAEDSDPTPLSLEAAAVIWATGFSVFNPQNKPYGYGVFKNVITNLELEDIMRADGRATRPSDRRAAAP